jgi:sugar/nucleoside kinase (ribokinase family)
LDILTLGDLVADQLLEIPRLPVRANEDQIARGMVAEPGGMANFLIMASRLGGQPAAAGALGDDPYGRMIVEKLAAEGVETAAIEGLPGKQSTTILVLVSAAGEHVFVGALGSARMSRSTLAAVESALPRAQAFYTNGYAFLETDPPELVALALEAAHGLGKPVSFDPGPQIAAIDPALMQRAIAASSTLFVTGEEAAALTGGCGAEEAALELLKRGPQQVVIKLGLEGCMIASANELCSVPGFAVKARDSAGAGDAFDAAFVLAQIKGMSLELAGRLANAAGAATAAHLGAGTRLPTRTEVVNLYRGK